MPILLLVYSIFLFCGVFLGLKAGSKVSLYMGIITGMLVCVSAIVFILSARQALSA